MLPAPAPTPPPHPPPLRTDTRPVEPDEQWKADLRKRIEHGLRHMVEDAQLTRDAILNSQPSESGRERALREYDESMNTVRLLAQDEFNRQLRTEMSERKWALDVVDSNSPDVARQQQWILDNIRKADEERMPYNTPDAPQNVDGVLSTSPQQQGDSERGTDGSSEGEYESGELEDDTGESDPSRESEEEGEEEVEEDRGGDTQTRQSRPPSRPNVPATQTLHSRSPVSRRNPPSRPRRPSNLQPVEGHDDEDAGDSPVHAHPARPRESQPYSPGGAPRRQGSGSQAQVWRPGPRAPEPSGLSRTFAHANGQIYSASPVQFPRRGSVNSTGSNSSGTGLNRAGSLNSDQYRSNSVVPHSGTERPPTQARDRIASNIGPRERQVSASASPHDRPSPPNFPTAQPRAIPGARPPPLDDAVRFPTSASPSSRAIFGPQRSPEDMRQGIAIPRGPTTPEEGPRGTSWGSSLHSRRSFGDFNVHRRHNSKGDSRLPPVDGDLSDVSDDVVGPLDDRQSIRSTRSVRSMRSMELEQMVAWWEAEARRKEEEANRKEEEASKKEEEARRLEERARQSLDEAKRLDAGARQAEASAKLREAAAQKKEAEAKHKEAEAKKREAEAQKREAEAQRKEEQARHREHEARRKEEQARWKEEEARRKEEEARKREEEVRRKEDDARKREDDARRREEDARQREMVARQKEDDARRFEEEARKKADEARQKKEEAKRIEEDYERRKREIEQREAELKRKEAEFLRKEQAAYLAQEQATRQAEETTRIVAEETTPLDAEEFDLEAQEPAKADASDRTAEDPTHQVQEAETAAPEQEKQFKAKGRKGSKAQAKRQKEEQRQKEQEQQRLEEQRRLEEEQRREEERLRQEREREEQIRLDEELSRQEQERLDREALLEQERLHFEAQEKEANRIREEQLRAAEEVRYRQLEEQRHKVLEQERQRDELRHQQQQQQDEILRQRAKEEQQKEFERREAQYYQRTLERGRQNSTGGLSDSWNAHRAGSTTGSAGDRSSASSTSTFSSSAGSTWSSRPTSTSSHTTNSSFTSSPSSIPPSSTPRPSPTTARPGAPGTSPYAPKFDDAEWARRAEERARQQAEQFKREQERLENERQAKSTKVLSREELIRLYDNHNNKWRQLKDSDDNLGWNSFAWPVFKRPSEPEEITTHAISAYVMSKYAPGADSKVPKDRIRDHLRRWHPDKFETRILPRVVEEEREKVKAGAGVVARGLNELLNRNYED